MTTPTRVVIVGGGFGGLHAARALRKLPVEVTLVDRRNFHLFQPLLYQVATGGLSPANIAAPLRGILRRQKNARVVLGEAVEIDAIRRQLVLRDGELPYDFLILATGSRVRSASSKAVRTRRRISVACSTVFSPGANSSHSGCPK